MRDDRDRLNYRYQQAPGGYTPYPQGYPRGPGYPSGPPQPPETGGQRFLDTIGLRGWRIWLLIP
ncbi:MAG: hypothetical protein MUP40_05060, partial [Actinobacteria bacterium]|nr:hypothetical protein [Actinomycetota bacterium]